MTVFTDLIQAAADDYAAAAVTAATGPLIQQAADARAQSLAAQTQLGQVQTQLAAAVASDAADRAVIGSCQATIAALQAQLAESLQMKAPPPPTGWAVAFQDDFTGPTLDPARWTAANGDYAANELSVRTSRPQNLIPGPYHLTMRALRETYQAGSGTRPFTSAHVSTEGHWSMAFGRFLIRARWDDLFGMWPALWLRFDGGVGEIDIMEAVGSLRKLVQSVHQSTNGDMDKLGNEWPMPAGWSPSDWHVYGLERRRDGSLTWTLDGQSLLTRTTADLGSRSKQPITWLTGPTFAGGAHLRMNLQVGGVMPNYYLNGGQPIDPAKILPAGTHADFDVDWVQGLTPIAG